MSERLAPKIGIIVLAAGRSTRMGQQKMLLPLGDSTVVETVVDAILGASVAKSATTIVVVSAHAGTGHDIARKLADRPMTTVENPDSHGEMLSSVRCGLRALPSDCDAAVIALGDQPSIGSELIDELVAAFRKSEKGIVVPEYAGKRGHPLVLSSKYFPEVLSNFDELGLRGLLAANSSDVLAMPAANREVLDDMDEPDDYSRELKRCAHKAVAPIATFAPRESGQRR